MKKNLIMFLTILAFTLGTNADPVCNDVAIGEIHIANSGGDYCYNAEALANFSSHPIELEGLQNSVPFQGVVPLDGQFTVSVPDRETYILTKSNGGLVTIYSIFQEDSNGDGLSRRKRSASSLSLSRLCGGSNACRESLRITTEYPEDTPAQNAFDEMQEYHDQYGQENEDEELSGIGSEDERWFREMHDEHCNYSGCW